LECKVLNASLPIKAALQYSDKLKIDKFLINEKIKKETERWETVRKTKATDKRIIKNESMMASS